MNKIVVHQKRRFVVYIGLLLCLCLASLEASAQTDLKALLSQVEKNYPSIAVSQARAEAAGTAVLLERNTARPSLDAAYQANYATYNNLTGMSYPGQVLPISGPPSTTNEFAPVFGSSASLLLKWTPITFGQRTASIEYSQKVYEQQLAGVEDELLRTKFRAAYLYLEIAATQQLIKVYQKNIERTEFNLRQVATLVRSGIRPAVDSLVFNGQLSKARSELLNLTNLLQNQKYALAELVMSEEQVQALGTPEMLFQRLPAASLPEGGLVHPALKIARLILDADQIRLDQIKRSWVPKLDFWSTAYARGSGIRYDGRVEPIAGLGVSRFNYGLGFQLVFPLLDQPNVHLKTRQQQSLLQASLKFVEQTQLSLQIQEKKIGNDLATALLVAREAPVELEANESAYRALQTRYSTGLIDYTDLIESQYGVLQAEARLQNAYVNAWKALLQLAVVNGDLDLFLTQI